MCIFVVCYHFRHRHGPKNCLLYKLDVAMRTRVLLCFTVGNHSTTSPNEEVYTFLIHLSCRVNFITNWSTNNLYWHIKNLLPKTGKNINMSIRHAKNIDIPMLHNCSNCEVCVFLYRCSFDVSEVLMLF